MEWGVLIALAVLAAILIVLPRRRFAGEAPDSDNEGTLLAERQQLFAELRELDEDAAAGRISTEDRAAGRRALAPRLRAVTEALREYGASEDLP